MSRAHGRIVTVLDQIVSSASNFLLVGVVAHVSSPARFGEFSLGYVLLIFFLGLVRALVGEVMLVRFSSGRRLSDFAGPSGLAVLAGLAGAGVLLVGAGISSGSRGVWLTLALALPFVLLQDVLRYVMICCKVSGYAFLLDLGWLLLSSVAMIVLAVRGGDAVEVVAAWATGAALSAAVGLVIVRTRPRIGEGVGWLRENRDLSVRFSAEFASLNGSNALVWFVLSIPLGAPGVAALRGASLLFSPLNTGFNAIRVAMIPDLVRSWGTTAYRRSLAWVAGVLAAVCVLWGGTVLLLPTSLGELALGQTWHQAQELRLPNFAQALAMVGYTVLLSYFRSSSSHTLSSRMRGLLAGLTLLLPVLLGWTMGTAGAAWGFAAAVAGAVVWGAVLTRSSWQTGTAEGAA